VALIFFQRFLWIKQLKKHASIDEPDVSVEGFLGEHGIDELSIQAQTAEIEVQSTADYIPVNSFSSPEDELRKMELEHRIKLRSMLLYPLIIPMTIIPIWLMVLLTIPAINPNSKLSETLQIAYLTAVASDFAGLYYIITRDLFSQGTRKSKSQE